MIPGRSIAKLYKAYLYNNRYEIINPFVVVKWKKCKFAYNLGISVNYAPLTFPCENFPRFWVVYFYIYRNSSTIIFHIKTRLFIYLISTEAMVSARDQKTFDWTPINVFGIIEKCLPKDINTRWIIYDGDHFNLKLFTIMRCASFQLIFIVFILFNKTLSVDDKIKNNNSHQKHIIFNRDYWLILKLLFVNTIAKKIIAGFLIIFQNKKK